MAKSITEGSSATVHHLRAKGERPGVRGKSKQAAAAAAKAEEMFKPKGVEQTAAEAPAATALAEPETPLAFTGADHRNQTAPAFGANEPDCGCFLKHVAILRKDAEEEADLKLKLKNRKKVTKDHRQAAKAEGIVLGELDRAIEDADTEMVDLAARERRYHMYLDWLGKPINYQADLPGIPVATDTERDLMRWFQRGDQDGRVGKPRGAPSGATGDFLQEYLRGWDHGHTLLMQGSPLTAGAFNKDGSLKTENAPAAQGDACKMLTFGPKHFQAGTELDDANLKSLLPGHHEAFHNAETVVAVFGDKKRILREPGYVDDGSDDTEITEPVPVAPSASEFA